MPQVLDRLTAAMQHALQRNMDGYYSGLLDEEHWWAEMDTDIETYHTATYLAARGVPDVSALSAAQVQELVTLITRQSAYLDGFLAALPDLSEAQARARATMYTGALQSTYSRAQTFEWSILVHPGEASECTVNCRCALTVTVLDEAAGNADVIWATHAAESCPTCERRAAASPYEVRHGIWLKELY